jgi:hypothetical protein
VDSRRYGFEERILSIPIQSPGSWVRRIARKRFFCYRIHDDPERIDLTCWLFFREYTYTDIFDSFYFRLGLGIK